MVKPRTDEEILKSGPLKDLKNDVLYRAMEELSHSENPKLAAEAGSLMKTYALFFDQKYFDDLKKSSGDEKDKKMSEFSHNCNALTQIPYLLGMDYDYQHTGWHHIKETKPELAEKLDKRVNEVETYIGKDMTLFLKKTKQTNHRRSGIIKPSEDSRCSEKRK